MIQPPPTVGYNTMTRITNIKEISEFDPSKIREAMVEAADGIYLEDRVGGDYFVNIPVNRPVPETPSDQLFVFIRLLAESYIDTPEISCQYGGHVIVREGHLEQRYGAGNIKRMTFAPGAVILAVQPYLPKIPGITEEGSITGENTGKLRIGAEGYSIRPKTASFVKDTGKYRGYYQRKFTFS